jgi:hypothetical protein
VIDDLRTFLVPGIIAISFFIFGFFVTANALDLALREIVIGLIAGAVGGATMLVAQLHEAHAAQPRASASA